MRRAIAVVGARYFVAYNVWRNWKGIDVASGLPLQTCDLNGIIAPLALWTGNRRARATLYFWTFALTLQAFVSAAHGRHRFADLLGILDSPHDRDHLCGV